MTQKAENQQPTNENVVETPNAQEQAQPHHYPFQNTLHVFEQQPEKKQSHQEHCDEKNEPPFEWLIHHFDFNKWQSEQREKWRDFDVRGAQAITDFKEKHILSVGDMRVRSSLMFVTAGATYLLLTLHKPSMFGKIRNFAISFGVNGYMWVPELFNPCSQGNLLHEKHDLWMIKVFEQFLTRLNLV